MLIRLLALTTLAQAAVWAQNYEIGVTGGYGYAPNLTASRATASASTGIRPGGVVGVFGGEDTYRYLSGEARYLYRSSDLRLSSGSQDVRFDARTHIFSGDILFHLRSRESRFRPYLSAGGGVKFLQGMGRESASQPLPQFAALTATSELIGTGDAGAGVKFNLRPHLRLRFEVRDYISPAPRKVIAAAPGAAINGWWNDILGLAGISYTF